MNAPVSVRAYIKRYVVKYSLLGFGLICATTLAVTLYLARYKMSSDLEETATATLKAFRSRILEQDIRSTQAQIQDLLQINGSERAVILDKKYEPIYIQGQSLNIKKCPSSGETCFSGLFGQARIFVPIYFDHDQKFLFGYLYIAKQIRVDWIFVFLVFTIFALGSGAFIIAFMNTTKDIFSGFARELESWSSRLKNNPKDTTPLEAPPFLELMPLKSAIEGLDAQIEKFEESASREAKFLLLRGIAHDILAPVGQLKLYVATLENKLISGVNPTETMSDVRASLKTVAAIASQMKVLNDVEKPCDPADLGASTKRQIAALKKSEEVLFKAIQINFSAPTRKVITPLSDIEVGRIVANLVQNSVHASASGSIIDVEIRQNGDYATLSVKDSGCGVPDEFKDKVFEPDFTLKPDTGTGLGLAIVKYICDLRDARVEFNSQFQVGTKVTITAPIYGPGGNQNAAV